MAKKKASLLLPTARVKKPRDKANRWGIAEWYGIEIATMSPTQRKVSARIARAQVTGDVAVPRPTCPFLSTLIPNARCHKKGGVCSLQRLAVDSGGLCKAVSSERIVATCPSRFVQPAIFTWISEKMLGVQKPVIVRETPFLRKISNRALPKVTQSEMEEEYKDESKKAGRIDWILANKESPASPLEWCAVETQALYFSGAKMLHDFQAYFDDPYRLLYPSGHRRPDYRSSGPKRLWPQLDVKVPALRAWGKKVAVVVDAYFFANMHTLIDPSPRARNDRERRDNAEVIWFVVDFDADRNLMPSHVVYATLDSSRSALNATEPLSREVFTSGLERMIEKAPRNKVFRLTT